MLPRATGPYAELGTLLAGTCWESTRPALLESGSVAVMIVPRRHGRSHTSDVRITVRPAPAGGVDLVLTGPAGCWRGRLDAAGGCTIRDVPDARYSVRLAPG